MAPKKGDPQAAAAKKADAAKRAQKLADSTFGLKNKKGAKTSAYVDTLKKTVEANTSAKALRAALADPNSKEARAVRRLERSASALGVREGGEEPPSRPRLAALPPPSPRLARPPCAWLLVVKRRARAGSSAMP